MSLSLREHCLRTLNIQGTEYQYYSLQHLETLTRPLSALPKSLKILLENLLRWQDSPGVTREDILAVIDWQRDGHSDREIAFRPARVLMQDFTGVPAIVDLAAMREAVVRLGGDGSRVNPLTPVDLVIDHSVTVDYSGRPGVFERNTALEMQRNYERYAFLRRGQQAFSRFRVVPPGTGICHQVNLEYLGQAVWQQKTEGGRLLYPDTLVGTDSHTTMINGLGVLGWGVGGIEAEAAMLGQPVSMLIPEVIGFCLKGKLSPGITATDLVLTVTQMLRQAGVVGKFVEFYGDGLAELPLADRATIANMAPEYGATCGFFPIDQVTLDYMTLTGRSSEQVAVTGAYARNQGLWREPGDSPVFTHTLSLDLSQVVSSLAGPKRPQDRVTLSQVPQAFELSRQTAGGTGNADAAPPSAADQRISDGAVVIAAITSCTNTSNPAVMMAAGLLAKNALEKGLLPRPWVKTSLAPGSKVVTDYLQATGLSDALDKTGFQLVGYGCTTCIGNSGPLDPEVETAIRDGNLTVAAVLSGNRNFEGRIHPAVKTNWLASPPLVVAYALAGNIQIDLTQSPVGYNSAGEAVWLSDIWPTPHDIDHAVQQVSSEMYRKQYATVFQGTEEWQQISASGSSLYPQDTTSGYIRKVPFFDTMTRSVPTVSSIRQARILAVLGDSVTTDHISPAGNIKAESPAGHYLNGLGITPQDYNSYGSRRGNHEVMVRGTFANIRIRNEMVPETEGGFTRHFPGGQQLSIYDAAMKYQADGIPLAIIAGKEYGSGSSRDWAAKGPLLLGVRVVIAESFERIHRSNLIGMGILPLQFPEGISRKTLQLNGEETIDIPHPELAEPGAVMPVILTRPDGEQLNIGMLCRIDTETEKMYYRHGGILHYMVRKLLQDE